MRDKWKETGSEIKTNQQTICHSANWVAYYCSWATSSIQDDDVCLTHHSIQPDHWYCISCRSLQSQSCRFQGTFQPSLCPLSLFQQYQLLLHPLQSWISSRHLQPRMQPCNREVHEEYHIHQHSCIYFLWSFRKIGNRFYLNFTSAKLRFFRCGSKYFSGFFCYVRICL